MNNSGSFSPLWLASGMPDPGHGAFANKLTHARLLRCRSESMGRSE